MPKPSIGEPKTTEELIAAALKEGGTGSNADDETRDILADTLYEIRLLDSWYSKERRRIWEDALERIHRTQR